VDHASARSPRQLGCRKRPVKEKEKMFADLGLRSSSVGDSSFIFEEKEA
jgi:hypothetical protein